MKVYRVGGSVRDELLGRESGDRDWVVVGATPEAMVAAGFRPVGRDFPVFLHPVTHDEYALARTERKSGRGYKGFVFAAAPDVSLEQDLARRDLTINAMARAEDGRLVDPYGGAADLEFGVLRHVSPAFAEDPLRVLRVARFAARFGFTVADETAALMRRLVASGELGDLVPERVWQELARGLMEPLPSRMLAVLRDCGALRELLPELDGLYGVPLAVAEHPEIDAGVHVALSLDRAAARDFGLPVRYAILAADLAKSRTPPARWPGHPAATALGIRLADKLSARLKVPAECRDAARLAVRWRRQAERGAELRPAGLLDLIGAADGLRRPERLEGLVALCDAGACRTAIGADGNAPMAAVLREALAVVRGVRVAAVAREAARRTGDGGDPIATAIRAARLRALQQWRRDRQTR